MKLYFPQWQGSGTGKTIRQGAETILRYLGEASFTKIPLSEEVAEKNHSIHHQEALLRQLSRFSALLKETEPTTLQTLGGDCGLEIVPVSYLNQQYEGDLAVIWFDAHGDINNHHTSPSKNFHGMPLQTLLGEGHPDFTNLLFSRLLPEQLFYVGLRDVDIAEAEYIRKHQIFRTQNSSPKELIEAIKKQSFSKVYIHFDVDVLDPGAYKSTYYQVANGLSVNTCEDYLRALYQHFDPVGKSVLESVALTEEALKPIEGIIDILFRNQS